MPTTHQTKAHKGKSNKGKPRKTKTLARSTKLTHPSGISISTPLLVPSFSSKGFGFDQEGSSEITQIFEVAGPELLVESMLVSAYDLHYGYIPIIENAITNITFIDSGGYETSDVHDLTTIYVNPVKRETWTEMLLDDVYQNWSDDVPAVLVNFDDPGLHRPIAEQIRSAADFLSRYPNHLHGVLLKPERKNQPFIKMDNVHAQAKALAPFDVIGLTEKELGKTILERMKNIAELRLELDKLKIKAPIHVFGSLDPISSPLYFLAGAEIFDGLTWIRFGYHEGSAAYIHNVGAKKIGIDKTESSVKVRMLSDNYFYLIDLQNQMTKFVIDEDFSRFQFNGDFFREAYDLLRTKVRRLV